MSIESWSGSFRDVRGGCWEDTPQFARVTIRFYGAPGRRDDTRGFRLLRRVS